MLKNQIFKLFIIGVVLPAPVTVTAADIRIKFSHGRTSASVTGRIAAGGRVCYIARARSGQQLSAVVSSKSNRVRIFESGKASYEYTVEQAGEQSICVDNIGRATGYELTVSIK